LIVLEDFDKGKIKAGEFTEEFAGMFAYVSNRIPKYQMEHTR
jgi:hypothetical protein